MINRVLITSDLFRVYPDLSSFHEERIGRYYNLLKWQISQIIDLPVEKLSLSDTGLSIRDLYLPFGINLRSEKDWISVYDRIDIPKEIIEIFRKLTTNSLCIYIEASETIRRLHSILNTPFIDITVHPIRYLDDHLFGLRTNHNSIRNVLLKYKQNPAEFHLGANLIMSQVGGGNTNPQISSNSLLVVGQNLIDKALIFNGKLVSLNTFSEQLVQLTKSYDHIYFKPHPFRKDNKSIFNFLNGIHKTTIINNNIYHLLSNKNIKCVAGISSSCLYESRYFGKESIFFKKSMNFDFEEMPISSDTYISISDCIFFPEFWAEIFDALNINTKPFQYRTPHVPNRIRAALNDFWSQTDLDPSVSIVKKYFDKKIVYKRKLSFKKLLSRLFGSYK